MRYWNTYIHTDSARSRRELIATNRRLAGTKPHRVVQASSWDPVRERSPSRSDSKLPTSRLVTNR